MITTLLPTFCNVQSKLKIKLIKIQKKIEKKNFVFKAYANQSYGGKPLGGRVDPPPPPSPGNR